MTRDPLAIRGKTGKHLAGGKIRNGNAKAESQLGSRWDNYVSKFISYRCLTLDRPSAKVMDRATASHCSINNLTRSGDGICFILRPSLFLPARIKELHLTLVLSSGTTRDCYTFFPS